MIRKITWIIVFTALISSCNSKKNDLEKSNLKGGIWKLTETTFDGEEKIGKYQIGEKKNWGHTIYVYNEEGILIEAQSLDRKGGIKNFSKYRNDKDGNCIEIATYEDDVIIRIQRNKIYNANIVEAKVFDKAGKITSQHQYNYAGSNIINGKILNGEGRLDITFANELSSGLLTKQVVKDSLGEISSVRTYERNKSGDVIMEVIEYSKNNTENVYSFLYDYDEIGNWVKQYIFDNEGKIEDIVVRNIIYYDQNKGPKTENDFVGMWFVVDNDDWIELQSDKKYDKGYRDRIKETGFWEIDSQQHILTFRADDPKDSRKYKYDFEGFQIVLYTIQGDEKFRIEKR